VAKIAPMLGAALGGPLGAAAGQLVGDAFGIKDATPESIQAAIQTGTLGPDQIVQLKKAEQDFQLRMQEMGFKDAEALAELAFKDRDSARNREIQVKDRTPAIGFYGITLGFFGILAWMLHKSPPPESKDVLNIMLGSLGTAWITAVAYYYGASLHQANGGVK
jgi:hypothetical protein